MIRLKDELALVYQQLKDTVSKNEHIQASKDDCIRRLEEQLQEKHKEIQRLSEEVKSYDLKKIRDSVLEEAASHYEATIKELHAEADKTREQYNNLHYEYAVLKCKFDSRKTEYSHAIECLKLQHLEEVQQLQNKIEVFDQQKLSSNDSNAIELKSAKRDILQLNAKLKSVLAECEELRAQNENLTLQMNSTNRTQLKQITDNISNIRTLESEKQKAVMQKEVLEKELNNFYEQRRIMNNDLQAAKREILSLRNKLEECEHRRRIIVTDLQVEHEHLKAEQESDRQLLLAELSNLKAVLEEKITEFDNIQQAFDAKEQELQKNLMAARQQIWKQSNEFDQEKERMERKFIEFQNQKDQLISELNRQAQILGQNLNQCTEAKFELEKQFLALREQLEATGKDVVISSDMLSKQNFDLEKEIKDLKEQINILKASGTSSTQEKDKLISDLLSRQNIDQNYNDEKEILQLKLNWEQQKHQFHQRLEALESQLKESKNVFTSEKKELEQKIQQYSKIINKLKEKLHIHKVKNEELESQTEVLKNSVPNEVHQRVTNKLTELQNRLEEYRRIVAAEPHLPVCSQSSTAIQDKFLTDIKNLQLCFPVIRGDNVDHKPRCSDEKTTERSNHCRKRIYVRRCSLKARGRDLTSRVSSSISSSSELDLENL